jgi:hypothetical protein
VKTESILFPGACENVEKVEMVFKDGIGFDPAKLIQSVTEPVGLR